MFDRFDAASAAAATGNPSAAAGAGRTAENTGARLLGRATTVHGPIRRLLRHSIHFLAYRFVLARRNPRGTRAAGFRLKVRPSVFHPRFFISSDCFAEFIGSLDLKGRRVADVGTGAGILALDAAPASAASVLALDINPNAALSVAENARANGFGDRIGAICCNLFAAIPARPMFDVILSSPPKHAGKPRDLADRGWHAGPAYCDIAGLFDQARARLNPGGRVYVMVSSDTDLDLFGRLIGGAGFHARAVLERSILIESFIITNSPHTDRRRNEVATERSMCAISSGGSGPAPATHPASSARFLTPRGAGIVEHFWMVGRHWPVGATRQGARLDRAAAHNAPRR